MIFWLNKYFDIEMKSRIEMVMIYCIQTFYSPQKNCLQKKKLTKRSTDSSMTWEMSKLNEHKHTHTLTSQPTMYSVITTVPIHREITNTHANEFIRYKMLRMECVDVCVCPFIIAVSSLSIVYEWVDTIMRKQKFL